ncbi:hypothetical protein FIBSPDRAFT_751943, partial [Athelia psychrophila]
VPRKNRLGDLKIPTRKRQAQVSFMRDLRLAREFVGNVELKLSFRFSLILASVLGRA